jgi:hypothetical protein
VGTLGVLGCGVQGRTWGLANDEDDPIIPPEEPPIPTLACDYCVDTAPATYTGPSNFYWGKSGAIPDCQEPTPLQGIEGFLTEPTFATDFVRECRITPSDTCATEGKVCAPIPDEGYATCIHHTGVVGCEAPYNIRSEVMVFGGGARGYTLTLCCMAGPGPT